MAILYGNNINLNTYEIQNASLQKVGAFPGSPFEGMFVLNTATNLLAYYSGGAWKSPIIQVTPSSPIGVSTVNGIATISISPATTSAAGSMSAADKTKLDDSTSAATANTLVQRDSNGDADFNDIDANIITLSGAITGATQAVTKSYVDGLIDQTLKPPEAYDPSSGDFPTTYGGNAIQEGDSFRITGSNTIGTSTLVNSEDLLIALTDTPGQTDANWQVVESNRDLATETVRGVVERATQTEVNTGTDDERYISPAKLTTWKAAQNIPTKVTDDIIGNDSITDFVITHNLNTRDVSVVVYEANSPYDEITIEVEHTNVNSITVKFGTPPATGEDYRVVIIG